jgi:Aspartyl protease/Domain of unknown function (DUF4124)
MIALMLHGGRRTVVSGLVGLMGLVLPAAPTPAQMYRWTDERGQAHYSQGIDSVPMRFRAGAAPLPYQEAPVSVAPTSAATSPPSASGTTVIDFAPGKPIYVTARINDTENTRLILDTGADRTVIAPRALVAAGVSMRRAGAAGRIQGATGTADVEGFQVESIQVGNARVGRMLVVSHDINVPDIDGLLGRDFLEHFKVAIDNATGKATLTPR